MTSPALAVRGLTVEFPAGPVVRDLDLALERGRTLGIVGESGSGKSIALRAVMGILPATARVSAGRLVMGEEEVPLAGRHLRAARRRRLGMIFQDPQSALNPVMRVGDLIAEVPRRVLGRSRADARRSALELMRQVHLPDPERMARAYPHELSGGQRQRIMIAAALAGEPDVLLCDEPTTALDVTVQAGVLELLREITERTGLATVFVSHDLAVVGQVAHDIVVMQHGVAVERGSVATVLAAPRELYTRRLLDAVIELPSVDSESPPNSATNPAPRSTLGSAPGSAPRLSASGISLAYRGADRPALRDVDLALPAGRMHGLVGESGSGKTTLARVLTGQQRAETGSLALDGVPLGRRRSRAQLRAVQMVFQDPFASLDPRMTIRATFAELLRLDGARGSAVESRSRELLDQVAMPAEALDRVPGQFSGGQRQRIAIARALAVDPQVLIADEPTSALDVSVQAAILRLLVRLTEERGLAVLLISHNLAVVHEVCDAVSVLHDGAIIESGPAREVLIHPAEPYTRSLVDSVPRLTGGSTR